MGWNTSVVLIEGQSVAQVKKAIPDVFTVTKRVVGWEDASSSALYPGGAIGEIAGWVALWTSNTQIIMFEEFLESVSSGGRTIVCIQSSVSTIHGLIVYEKGKHRRTLVRENYEVVADAGDPLPSEAGIAWEDDESDVFEIVRQLTGVDVPDWETWSNVKFTVVEFG
jgi:hypothetical protein